MSPLPNPVLLAVIGAPHGVRGELRVKPFTEDPLGFCDYGTLFDRAGRAFEVVDARLQKAMAVVRFAGITTREQAEALNGTELFVDRSVLPATEDEDEFYMTDLIGLEAASSDGERLGEIVQVHDFGAGDILEIRLASGRSELFAFTRENFPEVDIAGGRVIFVPPQSVSEREGGRPGDTPDGPAESGQ